MVEYGEARGAISGRFRIFSWDELTIGNASFALEVRICLPAVLLCEIAVLSRAGGHQLRALISYTCTSLASVAKMWSRLESRLE